jgi:di/tricarboxylate transporter
MSAEGWFTLAIVAATIVLLAMERVPAALVILAADIVLLASGVIDEAQAFGGFGNAAPITVAALYVVAAAIESTGALEQVTDKLLGRGAPPRLGDKPSRRELARILTPIAAVSAFINNTPLCAVTAPRVQAWAKRTGRSPGHYLMPLSFAIILGGVVTTIGTSTNLVVLGVMKEAGVKPFSLFEPAKMGIPVAVAGLAVMLLTSRWLLPERGTPQPPSRRRIREFIIEMTVPKGSPLAGETVSDAGLRNLQGVFLVEIERGERLIESPGPEEQLRDGDRLTFAGNVAQILDLQRVNGLEPAEQQHFEVAGKRARRFFEVVIGANSSLVGSTLKDIGFRGRYQGAVVAIHRAGGERAEGKLGEVRLRAGDVLLVLGARGFADQWRDHRDFLVVSPMEGEIPLRREKARIAQVVAAALILLAGTGIIDIVEGALVAAMVLVGLRVISAADARQAVDIDVLLVIAASFGLGAALTETGAAPWLADQLTAPFLGMGDVGLLAGVLLATTILTALISNNASAVLMFPIALALANQNGLDARPFAMAVMLGASVDFMTPIGYQTNTMVYSMAGYRFLDFTRLGFPITLTTFIVALIVIPIGFPFHP